MASKESLQRAANDLVIANRILAYQGVFDEYGHVSLRHPGDPNRFLLARACAAAFVEPADILEFTLDGECVAEDNRALCAERFLHGAIYAARPEIKSVLYAASDDVVPFSVTDVRLRPVLATVGDMGQQVPVWDHCDKFGDTDLSVSSLERARDLARTLGGNRVVLVRGTGFVATGRTLNDAVRMSVYIPKNARTLSQSMVTGTNLTFISQGETHARLAIDPEGNALRRGWEYWAREAGCERWL
jgi:ribulose-5-phosphate 4-epimerase/fuculose-1-phosphate aldolase